MLTWGLTFALMPCLLAQIAAAIPPPPASIADYTVFTSRSTRWDWDSRPLPGPVATSATDSSGAYRLVFRVPGTTLPDLDFERCRVGLTLGQDLFLQGAYPQLWISPASEYRNGEAPSPTTGKWFGEALLRSARVTREDSGLKVELTFDSEPRWRTSWDLYLLIDSDGNERTGFLGGNTLVQNRVLDSGAKPAVDIVSLELTPGITLPGKLVTVRALLGNSSTDTISGIMIKEVLPPGIDLRGSPRDARITLRPGEVKRLEWEVTGQTTGSFPIRIEAVAAGINATKLQWLSVVSRRDGHLEFVNQTGAWLPYPARPTLQAGNSSPLRRFRTLPASKLQSNLFGVTAHIPRSTDEETPFDQSHLVDGNPDTCWASRWWNKPVPRTPEWVTLDLGRKRPVGEARFLPAWKNSGVPAAFTIEVSPDGRKWETVVDESDYKLVQAPGNSPLQQAASESQTNSIMLKTQVAQGGIEQAEPLLKNPEAAGRCWQCFKFAPRPVRFVRMTATRLGGGSTGFFCALDLPQFRIAELALLGPDGQSIALDHAAVRVSSTHCAWYNTPATTKKAWPYLFKCGVKLNRIGFWGDKTGWASVEKTRGVYQVDAELDRYITQSARSGVETMLNLSFGNNAYQTVKNAPEYGPAWQLGHPFLQSAPTTPEAVRGFANYCAFMAGHFRGRVKYFEIWNEPNAWFFDDWKNSNTVATAKAYGRLLRAAARAVKAANPDAQVVFGATCGYGMTPDYVRTVFEEGAAPDVDVFAFHPYGRQTPEAVGGSSWIRVDDHFELRPVPGEWTSYEDEVAAIRALLDQYKPGMPVWANEVNWFAPGDPPTAEFGDLSELTQAKYLARLFTQNAWLNCGVVWFMLADANHFVDFSLLRSTDLSPRAAFYSAGATATALDGAHAADDFTVGASGPAPADVMIKRFRNHNGEARVAIWRTSAGDDGCGPVPIDLALTGLTARTCDLVDTLYGVRQKAMLGRSEQGLVVPGVQVCDWPLVLQLR